MFNRRLGKKGSPSMSFETIVVIVLVLIILIFAAPTMAKAASNFYKSIFGGKSDGGQCKIVCDDAKEYPNPNVQCKNEMETYCVPLNKQTATPTTGGTANDAGVPATNPNCKAKGSLNCNGVNTMCDDNLQCVSACEYCASHSEESICTFESLSKTRKNPIKILGIQIGQFNNDFKCGCSAAKCNNVSSGEWPGTCITNVCPTASPTSNDYVCCSTA